VGVCGRRARRRRSSKLEPIPEKNDEPVTVLVGKTFDDLVLKSNKNGML